MRRPLTVLDGWLAMIQDSSLGPRGQSSVLLGLRGGGFLPARWLTVPRLPANVEHGEPWWSVRPSELASRYGFDADKLRDNVNPEDLNDRQFDLVMAALRLCDERTGQMTVPEE